MVALALPDTVPEILSSIDERYVCPLCDGNNRESSNPFSRRVCTFCSFSGDVTFTELVAVAGTADYVATILRAVKRAIAAGTDKDYKIATRLMVLVYQARNVVLKKGIQGQEHLATRDTLIALGSLLERMDKKRHAIFTKEMRQAIEKTQAQMRERNREIEDGCDLRRQALEDQREIAEKYDQRY